MHQLAKLFLCLSMMWGLFPFAGAQDAIGYFSVGSGDRQLGTIDPDTGTVAFLGSPIGGGTSIGSSGGNGALDWANLLYFFVGTPSGGSASIYSINILTGAGSAQVLSQVTVIGLEFDDTESTLYAMMNLTGQRQLATIAPNTGTVSLIGSPLDGGNNVSSPIDMTALDATGNRLFFIGTPSSTGNLSVFTIDTATGNNSAQALSFTNLLGLEYDELGGVLYAIAGISGQGFQLSTIDPATGTVTMLSSPVGGATVFASSGASAINLNGDEIHMIGRPSGGSLSIFTFSIPSGVGSLQTLSQTGNGVFGLEFPASGVPVELMSFSID